VVASYPALYKAYNFRCCYGPPNANSQYLDNVGEILDSVCDVNREVYFLGDLNIDWFSSSCALKRTLLTVTRACNLVQIINQPTKVFTKTTGIISSTCIHHIFTNTVELCSKAISIPIGVTFVVTRRPRGSVMRIHSSYLFNDEHLNTIFF
jgi:hypothetical protein